MLHSAVLALQNVASFQNALDRWKHGLAAASIGITVTIHLVATRATPKTFSLALASVIATGITLLASRVSNGLAAASIGFTVTIHLVATMATPKTFSLARASMIATGIALLAALVSRCI